jgi:hypothetical protein
MGMSWCRLGDLFKESRMALCVVLGRFRAGDIPSMSTRLWIYPSLEKGVYDIVSW